MKLVIVRLMLLQDIVTVTGIKITNEFRQDVALARG